MPVPGHADVVVLKRRPEPALLPGDLARTGQLRVIVSEFDGLERAPEALASLFDRGSPYIGRRAVKIAGD